MATGWHDYEMSKRLTSERRSKKKEQPINNQLGRQRAERKPVKVELNRKKCVPTSLRRS